MKKVLAVTAGFIVSTVVYLLIATGLFKESYSKSTPAAVVCGIGTAVMIALLFNKKRMQLIPVRVKKN
jgi:zinc transporter ZupT